MSLEWIESRVVFGAMVRTGQRGTAGGAPLRVECEAAPVEVYRSSF